MWALHPALGGGPLARSWGAPVPLGSRLSGAACPSLVDARASPCSAWRSVLQLLRALRPQAASEPALEPAARRRDNPRPASEQSGAASAPAGSG